MDLSCFLFHPFSPSSPSCPSTYFSISVIYHPLLPSIEYEPPSGHCDRAPGSSRGRQTYARYPRRARSGAQSQKTQCEDKKIYEGALNCYLCWQLRHLERVHSECRLVKLNKEEVRTQYLGRNAKSPHLVTVKDFFQLCIATSQSTMGDKTTTDSMETISQCIFAGFT